MVAVEEVVKSESGDLAPDEPLVKAEACRKAGNELLTKGDYGHACKSYDDGLLAIVRGGPNKERESELRLSLHLNASLARLRRGNLTSAVEHASGALSVDPKSVKGLYRRGLARVRLSEHPGHYEEAKFARADFEHALQLDPNNTEVRKELQRLRVAAQAERKELDKSQRETFKGIFKSDKPLYEDAPSDEPPPAILKTGDRDHKLVLSAANVAFRYDRTEEVLTGVDLELRAGWCVGIFGNNASGKTTLARVLNDKLSPAKGKIVHHGKAPARGPSSALAASAAAAVLFIGVAVLGAAALGKEQAKVLPGLMMWWHWALLLLVVVAVTGLLKRALDWHAARRERHLVLHVTSESTDKDEIPKGWTIERAIGEKLSRGLSRQERRNRVIAMLRASGFQMYNQSTGEPVGTPEDYVRDGLRYGALSGGQRHLIYVLRCFAARPAVILCDEVLGGLDAWRQPRVLHMLKRLKKEAGTAVLYVGTELHQLRLAADSLGFLHKGKICELGPVEDILDFPKHPATKEYVQTYRGLPGGHVIGGKLAEGYAGLENDKDLLADWLPL